VSSKVIVCRCEDVTLDDVQHTLGLGYRSVEEVKRYTGLGTGPCQGKECMALCAALCHAAGGLAEPFTSRPPSGGVSFAVLAKGGDE
jgi:bacterioferritin-associated ferredoxin